ncbi:MAG: site-2 protease family protein [Polyangiales bacterium]
MDHEKTQSSSSRESMFSGVRLGRIFGVEIVADWSLLIIFGLVLFSLGGSLFPHWHPGWGPALTWGVATAAAVLFFLSILAHEMSHALVARAQGMPVRRITLFMFGGMAHMEGEPSSPRAELFMAIVGPITSMVIGIAATAGAYASLGPEITDLLMTQPEKAMAAVGPLASILLWLGPINVLLGVFNMIPGFPLDGGRVLRSILWWTTGDLRRATFWASGVGRFFGLLLMVSGVAMVFGFQVPFFGTGLVPGFWLVLIGWFLRSAAQGSYQQLILRQSLEEVTAGELMRSQIAKVPSQISVQSFIDDYVFEHEQRFFPVSEGDRFVGMVSAGDAKAVPADERGDTPVREIMTPASQVKTLSPDDPVLDGLTEIARQGVIPVVRAGQILGLLASTDLHNRMMFLERNGSKS